jgi:hypothetical protein
MQANIVRYDRILRAIVGVLALGAAFGGPLSTYLTIRLIIGVVGLVLIATSLFAFCPAYRLFGIKT